MKITAIHWVSFTTILLITITIFAALNLSFGWVFYSMVIGQAFLVVTVCKVLKDDYKTDKTFRDFYEDRPNLGT